MNLVRILVPALSTILATTVTSVVQMQLTSFTVVWNLILLKNKNTLVIHQYLLMTRNVAG